ncbi:MAG: hypothetical protein D6722_04075 [Bacteroidetes bacterium]|nr:MAG: hypothetical protein D6722_04075 [Bacteroidota bacterium]
MMHMDWKPVVLALLCLLALGGSLRAQVDSTGLGQADSLPAPSRPPLDSLMPDTLPQLVHPIMVNLADTSRRAKLKLRLGRLETRLKDELPELYVKDGKNRLRIHIPWRDDIDVPFPRGLLPAPIPPPFIPEVAWQRSLILPGWGQVYNRGYWKVPLFYAGYAAAGWWINYNQQEYLRYRRNYYCAAGVDPCDPEPELSGLDASGLRNRRNQFRQARDYGIIILAGWHILQVVEAYVDAHLKGFDVSEDLSFHPMPLVPPPALGGGASPGLAFTWAF